MEKLGLFEINSIVCGECSEVMRQMPKECVDLTVTSPPYDDLRGYEGYTFDFEQIAPELFRVTKTGGVVVWVVGDSVVNGSETGTSFRQALGFIELGFRLHDTMIFEKNSSTFPAKPQSDRYTQIFEYMFVLGKGRVFGQLICDKANKWAGHSSFDGTIPPVPDYSPRTNIWRYVTSFNDKTGHPAPFPEALARDHILSWSNPGDVVLDPMCGSGTTLKMAEQLERKWLGFDISSEYVELASKRLGLYREKYGLRLF